MKSVTICSSNRFAKEAIEFSEKLKKLGVNVYVPHYYTFNYGGLEKVQDHNKKFIAMGLTHDHFNKIKKGDVTFIFNKDGYSGNSVTLELGYATALGKTIYALSDKDTETCRDILFSGYASTPDKLAKLLK
jgi:nucleoside 2-deoxyribosyltransferase